VVAAVDADTVDPAPHLLVQLDRGELRVPERAHQVAVAVDADEGVLAAMSDVDAAARIGCDRRCRTELEPGREPRPARYELERRGAATALMRRDGEQREEMQQGERFQAGYSQSSMKLLIMTRKWIV